MTRRHLIKLAAAAACVPRKAVADMVVDSYRFAAASGYTAGTAVFDGSDYMRLTSSGPTGLSGSGNVFTFSFWVKFPSAVTAASESIFTWADPNGSAGFRLTCYRDTDGKIWVSGRNSGNTGILLINGGTVIGAGAGWKHIYVCMDITNTSLRKIYINGAAETLTVTTYNTANNFQWVATNYAYTIGANRLNSELLPGSLAEFWWDDSYLDNPALFASGGHPISLGSTGNTPTGSAPVFYFKGNGNAFNVNSGTGGNMTVTGSLGTDTPP